MVSGRCIWGVFHATYDTLNQGLRSRWAVRGPAIKIPPLIAHARGDEEHIDSLRVSTPRHLIVQSPWDTSFASETFLLSLSSSAGASLPYGDSCWYLENHAWVSGKVYSYEAIGDSAEDLRSTYRWRDIYSPYIVGSLVLECLFKIKICSITYRTRLYFRCPVLL